MDEIPVSKKFLQNFFLLKLELLLLLNISQTKFYE